MNQPKTAADVPAQGQAAKTTERKGPPDVNALMTSQRKQIEMALPRHMSPDRMLRIALTEIRKNPDLGACDPYSFLGAIIQCAQLGLEPGSGLGHAYLIPFRNKKKGIVECNMIPGYKGLIDLSRRSGQVLSISARIVHEKDKFEYVYGDDEKIIHVPAPDVDPGKITFCYAISHIKGGGIQREVMSRAQLDGHRTRFSHNNPVWESDFDEMCRKTLVRRIVKYLPMSPEMAIAIEKDDTVAIGDSQRNWAILDASYEPRPLPLDAEKMKAELDKPTEGEAIESPADKATSEADRRIALVELQKAVNRVIPLNGKPSEILGKSQTEIASGPVDKIFAAADRLNNWKP